MQNLPALYSIRLLEKSAIRHKLIVLPRPPRSAADIVELFGCELAQVIKTLLFIGDKQVLACVPGDKKVDLKKLCRAVGAARLAIASPTEVKRITGFNVGGVCPFLPLDGIEAVLDSGCLQRSTINIGAGTETTGIELLAEDLEKIWPGIIADISRA